MQCNCTSPFLQNLGYNLFSVSKAPTSAQIVGEGDVTSVIFPDGSMQLYFVPTNRQVTCSPFQLNANSVNPHCTANTDVWFIRNISHPLPSSLLNRQFPNVYGDQLPPPQFNSNFCINSLHRPDYYQKFHNDDSTSTTDIHYFYPSLRCNGYLKYSAEVQTEPLAINNPNEVCGYHGRSDLKCPVIKKTSNINGDTASSTSYMSVDSACKSKHKLTKKNKKKSKSKAYYKSRDHRCGCHLEPKRASDKFVATFAEKASGGTVTGGRHTQTNKNKKSKRSDIQTDIWIPIDRKSSSTLKITDSRYISQCSCSTSKTDRY